MEFLKPLPPVSADKSFELRSKVLGVYDKGKTGSVVETETVLAEKNGSIYTRALGSSFFVGQGGWGGPKGARVFEQALRAMNEQNIGPSTVNYPPPNGRHPDAVHTLLTTKESAHLYR